MLVGKPSKIHVDIDSTLTRQGSGNYLLFLLPVSPDSCFFCPPEFDNTTVMVSVLPVINLFSLAVPLHPPWLRDKVKVKHHHLSSYANAVQQQHTADDHDGPSRFNLFIFVYVSLDPQFFTGIIMILEDLSGSPVSFLT